MHGGTTCEALRFLDACGWRFFELSTEHIAEIEADPGQQARVEEVLAVLDELALGMDQAHAYLPANIAHPDSFRREADIALVERHITCCAAMGIRYVVMHPGVGDGYTDPIGLREVRELNLEGFARLADHAGALGITIAIENMMDDRRRGRRNFGARPGELLDLLAKLDHAALGICFDTSHSHVQRLDSAEAILQLGGHICCTHMSDNDGSGDQHLTPGKGGIDWPAVVQALREIGYEGTFNLEIPGESGSAANLDELEARTREALAVVEHLLAQ
jgi:sugar phosphate isomerase/epimerase